MAERRAIQLHDNSLTQILEVCDVFFQNSQASFTGRFFYDTIPQCAVRNFPQFSYLEGWKSSDK